MQYGLKSYLNTFYQHSRKRLPGAFALLFAAGLTEGIGLVLLLPLLASIGMETGVAANNIITTSLRDGLSFLGIPFELISILLLFLLLISLRAILMYWRDTRLHKMQLEFVDAVSVQLHRAFGQARWSFLMQQRSSDFSHVLTKDVFRLGIATQILMQAIVTFSLVIVYLLTSLYLSPHLTLLVMATGGLLLWVLKGYQRRAMHLGKAQTTTGQAVFASIQEFLDGIKLVKSYGAESHYLDYYKRAVASQREKQLAFKRNSSLAQQIFQVGAALLLCLFFYVAIEIIDEPISQLLILTLIFIRLMPMLSSLQRQYEQIMNMLPAYSAAMELKTACSEAAEDIVNAPQHNFTLQNQINVDNVSFAYGENTPVLASFNVTFPAYQTTAIMGESGSGKSTTADLLAGLMMPDAGKITIDTTELTTENIRAWRQQVAYVPQDVFLFHDTLRANMLWVMPEASDNELWQALDMAAARHFVEQLPQGLDTIIGERGIRLSGGERQRIALARALLRKPLLLILDEATSALDHENEQKIRDSLNQLHGSMTIVLIAHRLTTVESADKIIAIKNK